MGQKNFWAKLSSPILALAPMAGITDSAFRQLACSFGAQVVYSEMASVAALCHQPKKTLELLKWKKAKEKYYVVQLFGNDPKQFVQAVKLVEKKIKPHGIDINFGCPVKKILKQGAGAKLMQQPIQARKVIEAVLKNTSLPVSIKVRTQSGRVKLIDFLKSLQDLPLSAIMIHGRSLSQGFVGGIDYRTIKNARLYFNGKIIANGGLGLGLDIKDFEKKLLFQARDMLLKTQADGLGLARGALGRPFIFEALESLKKDRKKAVFKYPNLKEVSLLAQKHAKMMLRDKGESGIIEMRKHLCWYVSGFVGAKKLRENLSQIKSLKDIKQAFKES